MEHTAVLVVTGYGTKADPWDFGLSCMCGVEVDYANGVPDIAIDECPAVALFARRWEVLIR